MAQSEKIGPYLVLDRIDAGSYGDMLLVEDETGRKLALKRLKLDQVMDEKALELFEREVRVLKSLDNPAVPRFIDSGVDEKGLPYLVQEAIAGGSLEAEVAGGTRFDANGARRLTIRLLEALRYLHGLHPPVIHRDLKPANIILSPDGPVIVDFGAVCGQALIQGETSGTVVGTFGYMAPEMLKGQASPASDLYSLGATLLYTFSGREPESFPQERLKIQFRQHLKLAKPLANLLDALLEPAVEDRPQSADEALDILRGRTRESARASALVRVGDATPAKRRFAKLKIAGAATGVVGLTLFLIMGPVAFVGMLKSITIGASILVILFLLFVTFVGF